MTYELEKDFSPGDLLVFKGVVEHWAVYVGNDIIIHYNKRPCDKEATIIEESIQVYWRRSSKCGSSSSASTFNSSGSSSGSNSSFCTQKRYPIKEPSLGTFESKIYKADDPVKIVSRARQKISKADYNLLFNNCETFAKWCRYGVKMSEQAQKVGLVVSTTGAVGVGVGAGILLGAGVGSVVPVVGTAVGAAVGGIIGSVVGFLGGGPGGWAANQVIRKAESD